MEEEATVNSSELLELCSGLRAKDDENGLMEDSDYRKGEDCLYFAKALLRTLRREQRAGGCQAMSQLIVWEIPKTDLVPLILAYRRDRKLCMTVCKILVALTLPVTRAFNGVQQHLEKLQHCKELFTQGDVLAVLMGFLAEPLSKGPDDRTDKDTSTVGVMLNLFHNLLHIRSSSLVSLDNTGALLDDALLKNFFRENVMDFFVVLAQSIDTEGNQQWSMLITNVFFLIVDGFVPEDLSFCHYSMRSSQGSLAQVKETASTLKALRSKEKRAAKVDKFRLSGRHSRFGGSIVTKDVDGSKKMVDARQLVAPAKLAPKVKPRRPAPAPWDRMDRDAGRDTKGMLFEYLAALVENNVFSLLMHQTAQAIAAADVKEEFLPSFQADVNRYIRLVSWFTRFDYVRQVQAIRLSENPRDVRREHPVLDEVPQRPENQTFTLTHIETVLNPKMATFLFQRAEHLLDQKPIVYRDVHYVFRALGEMLNTCTYILCNGTMDLKYEAKKTLYQMFLDRRQFLDRLPWLIQHVTLSKMPKHYLMSLINLVDLTFIAMEKIEEIDRGLVVLKKRQKHKAHAVRSGKARYDGDEASEDGSRESDVEKDFIVQDEVVLVGEDEDAEYVDDAEREKQRAEAEKKKLERKKQKKRERERARQEEDEQGRFNNFAELQTQDFTLSDYVRKYQHNKVVEICAYLLEDFDRNTEELNMGVWRLFERIRTGSGDTQSALPAIFCQARVIMIFVRIFQHCRDVGNAVRPSIRYLEEFATHIIEELMRLTRNGMNAHIFAAMLFWRSLRENQDFEDMNMRLAYEEAVLERQEGGNSNGFALDTGADNWDQDDPAEPGLDEDDILLDPEAIAESIRLDQQRRAEQKKKERPKKAVTAVKFYCREHLPAMEEEQPEESRRALNRILTARFALLGDEEKKKYEDMAAADKVRFEREMDAWEPPEGEEKHKKKKGAAKETKAKKREREIAENMARINRMLEEVGEDGSSSEDVPLGVLAKGGAAKTTTPGKKAKTTTAANENEPQPSDGMQFTLEEDAQIRTALEKLRQREPAEVPRWLKLHANLDREDVTERDLVDRCRQLRLINAIQHEQMMRGIKK